MRKTITAVAWLAVLAVIGYLLFAPPVAPDVRLQRLSGEPVPLSEHRGEVVLVNFWSPECPPCIQEIPDLKEFQERYSDRDFTIVGVGVHFDKLGKGVTEADIQRIREADQRFDFNYPLYVDDGSVQKGFGGLTGVPEHVLLDRQGRIVHRMIGALRPEAMAEQVEKHL